MNEISSMDKTFLILVGMLLTEHIISKFIDYLRFRESLRFNREEKIREDDRDGTLKIQD